MVRIGTEFSERGTRRSPEWLTKSRSSAPATWRAAWSAVCCATATQPTASAPPTPTPANDPTWPRSASRPSIRMRAPIEGAASIVLAVKPQVLGSVVAESESRAAHGSAADLDRRRRAEHGDCAWCPARHRRIVRCMPNTPALYGAGVTALFANERVTPPQRAAAESILSAVGHVIWVDDEAAIDAVTAVSGSGPAYFFYLMEAMIDAGVALGLDEATARTLTLKTAYGAAVMANESDLRASGVAAQRHVARRHHRTRDLGARCRTMQDADRNKRCVMPRSGRSNSRRSSARSDMRCIVSAAPI